MIQRQGLSRRTCGGSTSPSAGVQAQNKVKSTHPLCLQSPCVSLATATPYIDKRKALLTKVQREDWCTFLAPPPVVRKSVL